MSVDASPVTRIVELVRERLAHEPAVQAIFLNGSYVAGLATPGSDVDFTILVRDRPDVDSIISRLGELFDFRGCFHEVPHYQHHGTHIAVCIYPRAWTDDWVANAFRSADDLLKWQGWYRHKIVDAVEVLDTHGILAAYRESLAAYPDTLAEEIATTALDYLVTEFLDDWSVHNVFHFAYCLRDILEHVGLALYARNRRFFAPPLKHWHCDIPALTPRLADDLSDLVSLPPDVDLLGKRDILARIVEQLRDS